MAYVSRIKDSNNSTYNIKAYKTAAIPFGQVDSTSTSTAFTATVDGINSLYDGVCVWLRNGVVKSAEGCTLDINQLGAKPIYSSMSSGTAVSTTFAVDYTMLFIYNSTRVSGGCWDMVYGYYTNTTMAYGYLDYYFRPYAGQAVYRYKYVMQGQDNRVYPIVTTNQTTTTQVAKTPTTVGLRPDRLWYHTSTSAISAGSQLGAQTLQAAGYTTGAVYNFNTDIAKYRMVYLRGTYDKTKDLFYLYNDGSSPCTSYYTQVPSNTANIILSDYFVSGYYYLLVGGSYSAVNYLSHFAVNPLYYFDGTNLIPKDIKIANDIIASIPTNVSDLNNDSGYLTSAVTSFNGSTGAVTYAAPVTSVNASTGAVVLGYSDVGAAAATHTHAASDITSGLANVATSGNYNDLNNKPTYSLSMSSNIITLTGSDGNSSTIALPIYNGSVSAVGG